MLHDTMLCFKQTGLSQDSTFPPFITFGLLLLSPIALTSASNESVASGYRETNVTQFVFYESLGNPCGFSQAVPTAASLRRGFMEESSAFTTTFLRQIYVDINMAIRSFELIENNYSNFQSCSGISITSLPLIPSMKRLDELRTMVSTYERGIFLIAHLHIAIIDRQMRDGRNDISDGEAAHGISSDSTYLSCSTEPTNFVTMLAALTRRLESLLCTLVSQATSIQRASFRLPLRNLEHTRIYRYSACSDLQARDCVLLHKVRQVLFSFRSKYKQLLDDRLRREMSQRLSSRGVNELENEI